MGTRLVWDQHDAYRCFPRGGVFRFEAQCRKDFGKIADDTHPYQIDK